MKNKDALQEKAKKARSVLGRCKYVLLVIAAGLLLLLLPTSRGGGEESREPEADPGTDSVAAETFSVEELERRLAETLSAIDGAGEVRVMLTVQSGTRNVLAEDGSVEQDGSAIQRETQTVVVSTGSGTEEAVLLQQIYPQFQGALVVASGGGDPEVRLKLTEAVSALTGLGADKISVCKGKTT